MLKGSHQIRVCNWIGVSEASAAFPKLPRNEMCGRGPMDVCKEAFLPETFEMSTNTNQKHTILFIHSIRYLRNKKGLNTMRNQHHTIFKVLIM